ncbi:hypothetical protein [Listeria booriae]|uniref:Uncharacterized protein n=1 Tax=Listeria booriae TaxID=1552123 RepID=A0A7X0XQY2_9LIST|nr:hypothetical protein [Listeria booriae]MBC1778936.1 hypothetical protein [Listeria booriae]
MNTLSQNKLIAEIYHGLVKSNDSYVTVNEFANFDKKRFRDYLNEWVKNSPQQQFFKINIFKNNRKSFNGSTKEILKFLILSSNTDVLSEIAPASLSALRQMHHEKINNLSKTEKFKIWHTFLDWLDISHSLNYVDAEEYEDNKRYFLELLQENEQTLDPSLMDDNIAGFRALFFDIDEYHENLFHSVFKFVKNPDTIDAILQTYYTLDIILLATTAEFLENKYANFIFPWDEFYEDLSHNDNIFCTDTSKPLVSNLVLNLIQHFENTDDYA